jgi:magnesium transporter
MLMTTETIESWDRVRDLLNQGASPDVIETYLEALEPGDLVRTVFRLNPNEQRALLRAVSPDKAAELIEDMPDAHAADLIDDMPATAAAAIVEEMASDHRADILGEMDKQESDAILEHLEDEDAEEARRLINYPADTAGGLMMTEFAVYPPTATVRSVVEDLTGREGDYTFLTVHYIYVATKRNRLKGVLRLRDMVFADPDARIGAIAQPAIAVGPDASLGELDAFFHENDIAAVPVMDERGFLLGIVRRRALLEALAGKAESDSLKSAGIVGGEELRSMPVTLRARRRLGWLSVNIVLNIIAASVIAMYQDTLSAVIALAVFLPIVSDMSGCSGNQAVAVSMRELTLGAIVPADLFRVWRKEVSVGLINGLVLGSLLAIAAWAWKGKPMLGLVVGSALAINTIVAVSLGGTIPLALKQLRIDPAVASGPVLTTVTDMCGFFLVLSLASLALPLL